MKKVSRFSIETEKDMKLVRQLKAHKHSDCIYAEATFEIREETIRQNYGKTSKACFCKLFRNRCPRSNIEMIRNCDFAFRCGGFMDHGCMYCKDGVYTYIGQPYALSDNEFEKLHKITNLYGLSITVSALSSWFPSQTVSIVIQADAKRVIHEGCMYCFNRFGDDADSICAAFDFSLDMLKIRVKKDTFRYCKRFKPALI